MTTLVRAIGNWLAAWLIAWDRFWFTPSQPHTLALIRILAGGMLFYTHLVWALDLDAFLGPHSWVSSAAARELSRGGFAWSYLWYVDSPVVLWVLHVLALLALAMLTVGLCTRVVAILAWLATVAYCHRLTGALFGLDQVNAMLAMYLMVGPSGAAYSLDRWLGRGRAGGRGPQASVGANVAIRLIQLHLCIIYLFGGIGKMRGELWWDGSALWYAIANLEYQSLAVTWLVRHPWLIALLTHVTVFWETFYWALVWNRLARPAALVMAVCVHGGIALCLGMPTFGIAMITANLAFVSPETVNQVVHAATAGRRRAGQGGGKGRRMKDENQRPKT